ncbi:MAG: GYD domain-containing protein [Euryarchaeota archaeon]|nr:GYD domain-containing protein [Euryarchaeota archaeon]
MGVYVVMSKLTQEGRKTLKGRPERLKEVNREITRMGAKVIDQYALLGRYDFMTILEAGENETVAKIMVALGSRGTLETATISAIPVEEFLEALKEE